MRLISLVPSLTRTLCDFGFRDRLVGCTKFCIDPPGLHRTAAVIGGTKDPDLEAIAKLQPSHIFVNSEENKPEHIDACRQIAHTVVTFPRSPGDVGVMFCAIGEALNTPDVAATWRSRLDQRLEQLAAALASRRIPPRRYLYYIWREPYMVAGVDTYISRLLALAGFENALAKTTTDRYPEVSIIEAQALRPDVILFSSEPYPFRARDAVRFSAEWKDAALLPAPEILRIDGQLFSWWGTMTVEALDMTADWLQGRRQFAIRPFGGA